MRDKISVKQSAPGIFTFTCKGRCGEPEEIWLLDSPNQGSETREAVRISYDRCEGQVIDMDQSGKAAKSIADGSQPEPGESARFTAEIPKLNYRPYFLIREKDREYIAAERTLPVGGMNNFRDMGGYETCDHRTVKWGMLYRSGHFHSTTDEGLVYLRGLGIRTIIDYRSSSEIEKYPNREIEAGIRTFVLDPEAHTAELSAQFTSSKSDEDANLVNKIIEQKNLGALVGRYDIVMEQYRNFVEKEQCRRAFARMLEIAAQPDAAAVVQHCRGGKDRTGFGSLLLLGVLGVDRETIVEDYMLTGVNRIARNEAKMEIYRRYTKDPDVLAYLYSLIETRREFIEASYDRIAETYGSVEGYVQNGLGVGAETIAAIRRKYLTEES